MEIIENGNYSSTLGLYGDNGKEYGNYYTGVIYGLGLKWEGVHDPSEPRNT